MTWAERVGDLATRLALVILTAMRIVTELLRLFFVTVESFIMDLGERTEAGLQRTETADRAWVRLPGSVLLGAIRLAGPAGRQWILAGGSDMYRGVCGGPCRCPRAEEIAI